MSQYTIIYKSGKVTRQLKFKRELKHFPSRNKAVDENRFAPELDEKEVIELLEDLSNILGAFYALVGYLSSDIQQARVE